MCDFFNSKLKVSFITLRCLETYVFLFIFNSDNACIGNRLVQLSLLVNQRGLRTYVVSVQKSVMGLKNQNMIA